MPYRIRTPVKIYSNAEYGQRLIFVKGPINPRDELGKIGITFHGRFSRLFRKTIALHLDFVSNDGKTKSTRPFYVNRNSLIKYLQTFSPTADVLGKTDDELVDKLRTNLWNTDDLNAADKEFATKQGAVGETGLRHVGAHNKSFLYGWKAALSNSITGKLLSWLYQKAIGGLTRLKMLFFFFGRTEADQLERGELLARGRFKEAAATVPAYIQLFANKGPIEKDATFAKVPIISKAFIKEYADHDWDLHCGGVYPQHNKTDTSTGTTGKPTQWVRSARELETVKKSLKITAEIELGERRLEYINAFAFGPWATGLTTYEFMRDTGSVFASGADMDKILDKLELIYNYQEARFQSVVSAFISKNKKLVVKSEQLKLIVTTMVDQLFTQGTLGSITADSYPDFRKYFSKLKKLALQINAEKAQVIIAGYPPFLKDLINYAAQKNIPFKKYKARAVVGGQAISEALRDKLVEGGFQRVNSSYGASDLDINLGVETEFEHGLRKAIEENPGLARELFGKNKGLPMVFHYDPFNYHVEVSEENELIFTCNRSDRSSPRIRYNLGDKGRVYAASDMEALLLKYNINLKPSSNLPLLFVWGRESEVIYAGANVGFTDLERAITTEDKYENCLKSAFYSYQAEDGTEQFDIWIELKEGVAIPEEKVSETFLRKTLLRMAAGNQDFAYQLRNLPNDTVLPGLRFFSRAESPIQDANGQRKQVLVFKKGENLNADYKIPEEAEKSCRFAIKMTEDFKAALNFKAAPVAIAEEKVVPLKRNLSRFQYAGETALSQSSSGQDQPSHKLAFNCQS